MSRRRSHWASLVPFGVGKTKPRHFTAIAGAAWQNRDQLPYAWRILRDGVCDGCALGTSGLQDWTISGTHLCMVRLDLLRLNTMPALDVERLEDAASLTGHSAAELRDLGRLPVPLVRHRGDPGFRPLDWDEALDLLAGRLRQAVPERIAFYLTSRGIPNETYYVAQKAARFLGTPHVDNSARLCHAASTVAMRRAFGHGASTGSYRDWIGADLIVFFGSNTPNNQPVTTKYLYYAKQRGTEVAVVNPYREPGLDRYWVPSILDSALFGTRLADHWFEVDTGGDLAFASGVLKALLDLDGGIDEAFVAERTVGFAAVRAGLEAQSWAGLEAASGTSRGQMTRFARLLVERPNTIFVWSMGLTQHAHGVETIQALCNLGLARGLLGRPHRGLTPIRGHSGVQGGAEVGAVPVGDAATLAHWQEVWGFVPPAVPGLSAVAQIEAAAGGNLDVWWLIGGNFLDTVADAERTRAALAAPALRIHQDILLNPAMLIEPSDQVVLLPAATRYEIPGGCTETTTERRIVFSPEIPGPRIGPGGPGQEGGPRPEWEVLCAVMGRVDPERAGQIRFDSTAAIRREIARAIPLYSGIETLEEKGDQVQWGGPTLFADGRFGTADGKGHFVPAAVVAENGRSAGELLVSTRRGRQFNSMIRGRTDGLTGAERGDILMSRADATVLGLEEGERIRLRSSAGALCGRLRLAPLKPGNVEVYWPEGMRLLANHLDPDSGEPDYNTVVRVEREATDGPGR